MALIYMHRSSNNIETIFMNIVDDFELLDLSLIKQLIQNPYHKYVATSTITVLL